MSFTVEQVLWKNTVSSEIECKGSRINSRGERGVTAVKGDWAERPGGVPQHLPGHYDVLAPPAEKTVVLLWCNGHPSSKSLVVPTCVMKTYRVPGTVPGAMHPAQLRTWPCLQGAYSPREKQTSKEINHFGRNGGSRLVSDTPPASCGHLVLPVRFPDLSGFRCPLWKPLLLSISTSIKLSQQIVYTMYTNSWQGTNLGIVVQIKRLSVFPTELCKNPGNSNRLPFIGRLEFTGAGLGTGAGFI